MRILMLDNEFPPLGGGMGTVNRALLECYARKRELEIDLITSALGRRKNPNNLPTVSGSSKSRYGIEIFTILRVVS